MNSASDSQACFPVGRAQVNQNSKIGFKSRDVAVGSPRPEYPESGSRERGVGVPNTAIRLNIRMSGGSTINSRDVEGRRGSCMSFEHVGNAGGGVAVLRGELVEERLSLVVNSGITAKLRACAWWRTLVRQEPQDRISVERFELLWQTEERVYWQVVGAKYRQEGVLSIVHVGKRLALPGLVDDAAVAAATKGAGPITSAEVPEPLGSGAHGQALRGEDQRSG